jgi:hypothetical protein
MSPEDVAIADFDGDGKPDLAVRDSSSATFLFSETLLPLIT